MKAIVIFIGVVLFVFILGVGANNNITSKEEVVFKELSNLESCLQRRYDLIPNLVSTVKGYATHEQKTLEAVVNARSKVGGVTLNPSQLSDPNAMKSYAAHHGELQGALHRLLVVAESYPQLKANEGFMDLQHQLEGTENRINYARTQFNESVRSFNSTIRSFPASVINSMFTHLDKKCGFQADEKAKENVVVNFD